MSETSPGATRPLGQGLAHAPQPYIGAPVEPGRRLIPFTPASREHFLATTPNQKNNVDGFGAASGSRAGRLHILFSFFVTGLSLAWFMAGFSLRRLFAAADTFISYAATIFRFLI